MRTRIRAFRKQRGLTLQQLADAIGTTAQTVQRLETGNMTVSTDWLERIADPLGVRPVELIEDTQGPGIAMLGSLEGDGHLAADADAMPAIRLDAGWRDLVAVRLQTADGPYGQGSTVIANRLGAADLLSAHGRDCLVALSASAIVLGRVLVTGARITIVPLTSGRDVRHDVAPVWVARIVMHLRYV